MKRRIAITMGEPGGVGPEIIVKALADSRVKRCCRPVIVGNAAVIEEAAQHARVALQSGSLEVINIASRHRFKQGLPSKGAGRAVVQYIEKAVELVMNGAVSAIVTAPISKESLDMAGHTWPGHTELLAELTGTEEYAMMFVSRKFRLILCTIHIPLMEVPNKITKARVVSTIRLALRGCAMLGTEAPHIAVAGLNPHAGESGVLGKEEERAIAPAIEEMKRAGVHVSGPYPPDVLFHKAYQGEFDMIVCMYHDQGLIPFKMMDFERGVNVTVGLPFIRTSPDHGTAFDIAGKNKANPSSMIEAIKLASKLELRV